MHISAPFIRRPVATSLLSVAILLAGGVAFYLLPVAALPHVDFPTIYVRASLPGASPETVASSLATPLERQFGRIAGVTQMTSASQLGNTGITLQFDLDRDINAAARDVQAAINAAAGQLPAGLPQLPWYRKINPSETDILDLSISSETIPRSHLYDLSDSILAQKISQVDGVGQVNTYGGAKPAVRVDVNPNALAHYGLSLEEVRTALRSANANTPKGNLEDPSNRWVLSDTDQLLKPEQYAPLIVAYRNGAPVRLSDIAKVTEGIEDLRNSGYSNGKPAVVIGIGRQPGANIIETVDRIKALMPELRASIPPSVTLTPTFDRTTTIRASVKDIEFTLLLTVALVVMVIFLFLRNAWATVIPSIAVPLSIIGTFGVMYLLSYSLDNLSLMALAICTGFVVDDAIVVIENITRYLEAGESPLAAAMKGSREIGFTVLSMSLSLIAVFIPLLLMGGIIGRLFREFAITLSVAIVVSLCVSLTTTPMMCALFLKSEKDMKRGKLYRVSERVFQWAVSTYASGLRWVLRHQPFMLALTGATICLSVYLYIVIPKGFFPQQDTGLMAGNILGSQDTSFPVMQDKLKQYTDIVMADPAVKATSANTGGGAENTGRMQIELKPIGERKVTVDQVIARLRRRLAVVPGATLFLRAYQDITVGGRISSSQYQYTLSSENLSDLLAWAPRVEAKMRQMPRLRDIASDQQTRGLQATLVIDRDTASRLGISPATIDNTLYDAFGQRQVSTIYTQLNQYHVVQEVDSTFRDSTDAIQGLYVRSSTGTQVPLSAFTHYETQNTALAVNHQGQFPAVTISFNLGEGVALGDAVTDIESAVLQIGLPSDIHPTFQGNAQAFQSSLSSQPWLILAALVAVYIVLGMLYESYIHPVTILSTLPSAGVGALLALLAFHTELTVIALIGIVLLIGIVKKNAIMMIDFALEAERSGKTPEESIYQACLLRFRPIMMTTMAALFGGLPLALATGTGAELRRPLGISIVGGLMVSQALTLYTTPVIYLYMDRLQLRFRRRKPVSAISGKVPPTPASLQGPSLT
ncbi:MAG TPA: multidrug efflux RND transporter permease subunit [Candidatus Acidoferrum sp.]|jgi:hydrophobe/amphiphile efflux-1 (HAE1) family protein|nr:multidrug efflux RND transporter permease subunit [Candidatus Acidoferrum sp.]